MKEHKNKSELILVGLVVLLDSVAIPCYAIGTWMRLTGDLPRPEFWFGFGPPNIYGDWPTDLLFLAFFAALLALPANIMFVGRVRRPLWLFIPVVLTIFLQVITFTIF